MTLFEATIDRFDNPELPTVREWLMDELEHRDADAFDRWIDSRSDSPRSFYQEEKPDHD